MNSPRKQRPRLLQALALGLGLSLLGGCATTYEMQVDAIKNPNVNEKAESYVLVPRDPDTDVNDLRYKESVKWIKTALSGQGMYEALDVESADMVIEVDYGMEPPRREFKVVQEPVFATSRTPDSVRDVVYRDPATGNLVRTSVIVRGGIRQEMAGFEDRVVSVVVNEKYLELTAKENNLGEGNADKPSQELWSVRVVNEDEADDLREYLPIMASAAVDYIGADTGEKKQIRLKEDDEAVQFVKRGLQQNPLARTEKAEQTTL